MDRSLQIHKLSPVIVEPDLLGLDIEAALTENDEGVDFAVPNITFEVRMGVEMIYQGQSDSGTGVLNIKNLVIGQADPKFEVSISAVDQVGKLTIKVKVDAGEVMKEIADRRIREANQVKLDVPRPSDGSEVQNAALEAERQRELKTKLNGTLNRIEGNSPRTTEEDFRELLDNQNQPYVRRGMLDIALKKPDILISRVGYFCEAVWAEEVLASLAASSPAAVLDKLPVFSNIEWAKKIVDGVAVRNPAVAFGKIGQYEYQIWAKDVAERAARMDPDSAIENYKLYQDQPWAKEVLDFARREKIAKDERKIARDIAERTATAERAVKQKEEADKIKWSKDNLLKILRSKYPDPKEAEIKDIVDNFDKYSMHSWAKEIMLTIAKSQGSHYIVFSLERFRKEPWIKEVLGIIAESHESKESNYILGNFSKFKHEEWAEEIFTKAAKTCAECTFEHLGSYDSSIPWVKSTIEGLAVKFPVRFLKGGRAIAKCPWLYGLYLETVESHPEVSFWAMNIPANCELFKPAFRNALKANPNSVKAKNFHSAGGNDAWRIVEGLLVNEFPDLIDDLYVSSEYKSKLLRLAEEKDPLLKIQRGLKKFWKIFD
ncbi:MAG: hypothetical protein AAB373_05285 [Patescibacteria group bacterium]